MNQAVISNINMKGIAIALPHGIEENIVSLSSLGEKEAERICKTIGIKSRRVAEKETTALDLMHQSLLNLFNLTGKKIKDVDCLVCVTQTPDHLIPGNSFLLCDRLGSGPEIFTIDINAGCAGFTHGLIVLGNLLASGHLKCGVLVVGDTLTKLVNPKDKTERPLFGDAAAACLMEFEEKSKGISAFWRTIAHKYDKLIVPAGGMRVPTTERTKTVIKRDEGIYRSENDLVMDGAEIFNFSVKEVPELISSALKECVLKDTDIDLFVFHQANKFMVNYIRKKLRLSQEKVPLFVDGVGNTSGVSIPLAICRHAQDKGLNKMNGRFCLTGFGVGLSLSTIITDVNELLITPVSL